jgi:hypothetical protein
MRDEARSCDVEWIEGQGGRAEFRVGTQNPRKQACLSSFSDEPVAEIVQCGEPLDNADRGKANPLSGAPGICAMNATHGFKGSTAVAPRSAGSSLRWHSGSGN